MRYCDFPEERKVQARERARKWRLEHPERAKEYDRIKSVKDSARRAEARLLNPRTKQTKEEALARNREYCRKWHILNREYVKQKDARRQKTEGRKATQRKAMYKRKYGITPAEYDAMVEAQNGRCAICNANKPGGMGRWCVDHCKHTGRVRALLCNACNPGLGFFKHDTTLLQRAIEYLNTYGPVV
jgi:hypothetical protein